MANGAKQSSDPGGLAATTFFSKTYDEANALLIEACAYIATARARPRERPAMALLHSMETMRLTARLGQIMAWLLVQRAMHAGELTVEEVRSAAHRLAGHEVCLDAGGEADVFLAPSLRDLLARSRKLYRRVSRLDEMIARD